jgi:hypothetical protein
MSAITKVLATCFLGVTLSGCVGHTHRLVSGNNSPLVTGSFSHEGIQAPVMVLELEGARYEGRGFVIQHHQDLAKLRQFFGPGKHYDQITNGMDSDHIKNSASPALRSQSGETIRCLLAWSSGQSPAGVCMKHDGTEIDVRFD